MTTTWTELIIDAADPESLAAFWAAVLGWERTDAYIDDEDGAVNIARAGAGGGGGGGGGGGRGRGRGAGPSITFLCVGDERVGKNRLHIDLNPSGGADQAAERERLLALGARPIDIGQGDQPWVVLTDPEGNEFCLLRDEV